jgi:hypothetical protein
MFPICSNYAQRVNWSLAEGRRTTRPKPLTSGTTAGYARAVELLWFCLIDAKVMEPRHGDVVIGLPEMRIDAGIRPYFVTLMAIKVFLEAC